ncbi:EamA family transporter [Bryobacter aggregatus]|uniref:EamA family transporter n=1 Tax=Bryobacter aggregatus TaxID=360054 RepID=UPI0004E18FE8|nr:EamA family transporter [Bryobacter aggregatus]
MSASPSKSPPDAAWWSLAAVCFFWGTTYLGIRIALEGFPPLLLVGTRFLLSGALILAFAWWRGWAMPRGAALWWPAGTGLLTLGLGNSMLTFSETIIPSGLAALFVTVGPFWMVGLDTILPGGEKFRPKALLGMLIGFSGAVGLVAPEALRLGIHGNMVKGFLFLQLSCFGWSLGSILQKRRPEKTNPILVGGIQQFSVGIAVGLLAILNGDWAIRPTPQVLGAVLYLALFGSILAYSAYLYSLQHLPVAIASIYTYVNPVVAITLGWLVYREEFGWGQFGAMWVVFLGVWLVKRLSVSS